MSLIKVSFRVTEDMSFIDTTQYLLYETKYREILKCGKFTYTFMANRTFINLTGCKSLVDILTGIKLFKYLTNVSSIMNLKVDTMNAVYRPLHKIIEPPSHSFWKSVKPRFPGVVYKNKNLKRLGCVIFPKCVCFFGFKSTKELIKNFNFLF